MGALLQDKEIILRWPKKADAARLTTFLGDYHVARMLSRVPHPYTRTDALDWIEGQVQHRANGEDFAFCITLRGEGVVGAVGLHRITPAPDWELGYWVARPFWGAGLATRAGRLAIDWAQQKLHLDRLTAGHFSDNPASGRVLAKLGFEYTGIREEKPCLARGAPAQLLAMRWQAAAREAAS